MTTAHPYPYAHTNERRLKRLHPAFQPIARAICNAYRSAIRERYAKSDVLVVSGYRSIDEQNRLYAIGRTQPGRIRTHARGGESWHNYGLAIDIAPVIDGNIPWNDAKLWIHCANRVRMILEPLVPDVVWGGNWLPFNTPLALWSERARPEFGAFHDYGHFEWHPKLEIADAKRYHANAFVAVDARGD